MGQRTYNLVTATIFAVVAMVHLLRIILGWHAEIGGIDMPSWVSWIALVVAGALAWIGFRQNTARAG